MLQFIIPFMLLLAHRPAYGIEVMKPREITASDSPARKLLKERFNLRLSVLQDAYAVCNTLCCDRQGEIEKFLTHIPLFIEAGAALAQTDADRLWWYELYLKAMRDVERYVSVRVEVGAEPSQLLNISRAARIDAEIELLKLKESLKAKK
jgi:hypothetical protein